MDDLSNKSETDSENSLTVFEVRSSDEESTLTNNRFAKENEYHAVPPLITGNPLTARVDISFARLDEYAFRNKIIESKTTIDRDEVIIEDSTSDDEDDVCAVKTVSSIKPNVTQAVRSHLIKDYDFYDQKSHEPRVKNVVNTGERGNPEILLQDHAVVDNGCSSHMTGNKAYLLDYEDLNGGFVAFGSDPKGDELNFKLLDESQVVLRAPKKDGVYNLDLKNIVPSRDLVGCDNGTEFKNYVMNEFCAKKRIKREFSVARTPQQNGVAERKNRTLIEAARTMLADSLLPIPFLAEKVVLVHPEQHPSLESLSYKVVVEAVSSFLSRFASTLLALLLYSY
ncbi:putative ribonuclease H-like domain-containing protein [Tanacetum coccineum]